MELQQFAMPSKPTNIARQAFAERLRVARKAAKYRSARAFSTALGVEPETYRRWERAETEPNIFWLVRLRDLLRSTGLSLDFLIAGEGPLVTVSPRKIRSLNM